MLNLYKWKKKKQSAKKKKKKWKLNSGSPTKQQSKNPTIGIH